MKVVTHVVIDPETRVETVNVYEIDTPMDREPAGVRPYGILGSRTIEYR